MLRKGSPGLARLRGVCVDIVLPLVFWLVIWQLAAAWVGKSFLLPGPVETAAALVRCAGEDGFWQSTLATLLRIFGGMAAGTLAGVLLALATTASPWADRLLSPAIRVVRATPVASFILLLLLWVTRTLVPGVIAGLMVLPVIWANVAKGIGQTDPLLLEMARAYRFGRRKTVKLVYIPSILPYFSSAVNTAMGLAWKSGVAAEVICRPPLAIGSRLQDARLEMETPDLFAWTAVVIVLSLALEHAIAAALRRGERRRKGP